LPLTLCGKCWQDLLGHLIQYLSEKLVVALNFAEYLAVIVLSNFLFSSTANSIVMLQNTNLISSKTFGIDDIQNSGLVFVLIYDFLTE
jgi:hypothetical protein